MAEFLQTDNRTLLLRSDDTGEWPSEHFDATLAEAKIIHGNSLSVPQAPDVTPARGSFLGPEERTRRRIAALGANALVMHPTEIVRCQRVGQRAEPIPHLNLVQPKRSSSHGGNGDHMTQPHMYALGLSLGPMNQPTALAIVERQTTQVANSEPTYAVRHLERFPLGTPYATVLATLRTILAAPALMQSRLVIDHTAVGHTIFDLFRHASLPAAVSGVTITMGHSESDGGASRTVPKANLVGTLQLLLQSQRLHIAASLPHATTLADELHHFQLKTIPLNQADILAWRERPHDDLVLAVAIALWALEQPTRVWARVL